MGKVKKEEYKSALFIYLITVGLLYLALSMPFLAIVIPFMLVYAVVRCGFYLGGAVSVVSFATFLIVNVTVSFIFAGAFLPVVFAVAYMIIKKKRFRDSAIVSSAAALVGALLAIGMLQLFTGMSVIDFFVGHVGNTLSAMDDTDVKVFYQTVRYADIITGAVRQDVVEATSAVQAIVIILDMLRETLNQILITVIVVYSLLAGFLYYIIPRAAAKSQKIDVISIPAFSEYELPNKFWLAYIISNLFATIGASYGWQSFDVLEVTIYYAYAVILVAQGLSFLDFLYKTRRMRPGVRVILHIFATLILSGILVWIGLFENVLGMRKRISERQV